MKTQKQNDSTEIFLKFISQKHITGDKTPTPATRQNFVFSSEVELKSTKKQNSAINSLKKV